MQLDNLVKAGQLKREPPAQAEFDGLVRSGRVRLQDAEKVGLFIESRFDLAYNAAHSLSLAALRWHGYRSEHRYIVFQTLTHTLALEKNCGACWIKPTASVIWRSTKAIWTLMKPWCWR